MKNSRLSGLHRKSVEERIAAIEAEGFLPADARAVLASGGLPAGQADRLSENVIGTYALPFSVATNFVVNGRDRLVAMSIEEPSVVAAASNAARLARECGGFTALVESHVMTAQVEVRGVEDVERAVRALGERRAALLETCRRSSNDIESFGGSVEDLEVRVVPLDRGERRIVVHVHVDCADAMGANTLNTIAEGVAPEIAAITGGAIGLRILTNLADRRVVSAACRVLPAVLAGYGGARDIPGMTGESVRDAVVEAGRLAEYDPYRAATHNKGIMNGIDAVALATGNDWRAIEAGAHAFAARGGRYKSLTRWSAGADGALCGEVRLPVQAGIVGGMTRFHEGAALALKLMEIAGVRDLETVMACAGLATNLAALLALSTEGIQRGHMRLHQRHG